MLDLIGQGPLFARTSRAATACSPAMETYAVRLLPRHELVERYLRRAEAERYVETFNRVMRLDCVRAELVREPVEEYDKTSVGNALRGVP